MSIINLYTDGSCLQNPGGKGGWAAIVKHQNTTQELSQGYFRTTNNRMEMMAAINGLKAINSKNKIVIHTDSQYLRNGITKWIKVWRKNKWRTKAGRAVKNIDLWVAISEELKQHGPIEWVWVKAHNGHPENERCDALAKAAAITGAKIADVGFQNPTISDDVTANTDTDEPQTNLVPGQANIVIKTFCPPDKVTKAAYAARIIYNNQQNDFSAVYKDTTTNRIELLAILDALTNIEDNQSVFVFTCSQYLQQGVTLWLNNWVANNWKTHNKKAVKNKDLWLRIFSEVNRVKLSCYYLGNQLHHIQSDCANLARQAFNTSAPILDGASVQSL